MGKIGGKPLFLDKNDINTDEIIPAKYLTEVDKRALAPYLLEDIKLDGFDPKNSLSGHKVIISKTNFGCGSSREHAVWVFTENGYEIIIAESFARIFRQNSYNNGLLAIELPREEIDKLFSLSGEIEIIADVEKQELEIQSAEGSYKLSFDISSFYKDVVKSKGWINYVDKKF